MIGKLIISMALMLCLNFKYGICSTYKYETKTIKVPLDHFSYTTNHTFELRYLINNTYMQNENSPILFYTGNEGDIELFAEATGFIWENAPKLNATIVFAEHRYYGKSLPFGNKSFDSPEHFGYLTSEQALADYAYLLEFLNPRKFHKSPSRDGKSNRPVIAIGGSYGGMLAAWFRMKYPYLVAGSLAASAPILQFPNLTPCAVFSQITSSVFSSTSYSRQCGQNIKTSWDFIHKLAGTADGSKLLNETFKFCSPIDISKADDQEKFINYLIDVYGNLAMVNYPYSTSFLAPLPSYPVREFCSHFSDKSMNDTAFLKAFQSAVSIYSNYTGKTNCLDISSAYDSSMGDMQWELQTCTEMVMPMCSNVDSHLFDMFPKSEWNFQAYSDKCFKKFGVRPNENAAIMQYGGNNLDQASNIIFSNGLLDPWSGGGVLRKPNDKIHIVIMTDTAHHLDLRAASEDDPHSVFYARQMEIDHIIQFINEHNL